LNTPEKGTASLPALFAATLFASALLLFWVQPMIARMLLPLLGGAPSVWNTCMVFFQAMLLAGYAYAHFVTGKLPPRAQVAVHLSLILMTIAVLPFAVAEGTTPPVDNPNPVFWLLARLFVIVGLPFFVVSTSAPLLQKWFSKTGHASAHDPYFLYAASNLGSLIALLSYPVVLEPTLRLGQQTRLWTTGYFVMAALVVCCALVIWTRKAAAADSPVTTSDAAGNSGNVTTQRRLRWIVLAFVPSSLMLGVTSYLTTDIASVPLLWVVPLAIYLLTFILVFAKRQILPLAAVAKVLPVSALALVFLMLAEVTEPAILLIGCHVLFFFIASMVCHGRLANDRPSAQHLTEFYLCMSIGGVIGGIFNALIAPVVFKTVVEYPLIIALACALRPPIATSQNESPRRWLDFAWPLAIAAVAAVLCLVVPRITAIPARLTTLLLFGVPLIVVYTMVNHRLRFALALGGVMLASNLYTAMHGRTLEADRNFFGCLRVTYDATGPFYRLYHGTTIHGLQFVDASRHHEPLSYYHRQGPLGAVFEAFDANPRSNRVGVIGLGSGAMACYVRTNQHWTFYEIDPTVVQIARSSPFFTYLRDCTNAPVQIVLGDARLRLHEAPANGYGLFVVDAFSSDVIPMHLITREAVQLYLSKLTDGGMIAFNISSRNLELSPVLGNLAKSLNLFGIQCSEVDWDAVKLNPGKHPSHWVVLARSPYDLGSLLKDQRWRPLEGRADKKVWTDDFSNILSAFRLN